MVLVMTKDFASLLSSGSVVYIFKDEMEGVVVPLVVVSSFLFSLRYLFQTSGHIPCLPGDRTPFGSKLF